MSWLITNPYITGLYKVGPKTSYKGEITPVTPILRPFIGVTTPFTTIVGVYLVYGMVNFNFQSDLL